MRIRKRRNRKLHIIAILVIVLSNYFLGFQEPVFARGSEKPLYLSTMTRSSSDVNILIPDSTGPPGYACWDFSGAPSNAIVDYIQYSFNVDHDQVEDLTGWIGHDSWNSEADFKILDRDSATGNDLFDGYNDTYDQPLTSYTPPSGYFYDGRSVVNQQWCLVFEDEAYGYTGRINDARITLYYHVGKPDLDVISMSLSDYSIVRGSSVNVDFDIKNIGDFPSTIFENSILLSPNSTISLSDDELASPAMGALGVDEIGSTNWPITIPSDTGLGTQYIGIFTDRDDLNDEINEGNNTAYVQITVLPRSYDVQVGITGDGSGRITSSPSGIDCPGTCTASFDEGTYITLIADPDTGSSILVWHGGTGSCSGSGTSCSFTHDGLVQTYVEFDLIPYTLSVNTTGSGDGTVTSNPSGINCGSGGSACSEDYDYETSVSLTPDPDTGSDFTDWSGACSGTGSCNVSMTVARSVTASFTKQNFTLTVGTTGSGSGTVTASGINCGSGGSDCTESYPYETLVPLTPDPDTGSTFTGWSGACTGTGSCNVSMTSAKSVTATFTQGDYILTASTTGSGSGTVTATGINCGSGGSDCSESYPYDTSVPVYASADGGSTFTGWSGDCTGTGSCNVSMTTSRSVAAEFTADDPPPGENVGLYNPSNSNWFLKYNQTDGSADHDFAFGPGGEGWKPIIGDWNDNGDDTIGLYNPLTSKWYLRNAYASGAADTVVRFGPVGMGWIPIAGDWNNNGNTTIGFYSPTTSKFYLRNSLSAGVANVTFRFGPAGYGWLPIVGDWDNDGIDEVGLYNPVTSKFYLRYTHTDGVANATFRFGVVNAGWLPIAGDWDDNGADSAGLYKPDNSKWYLRDSFTDGVADTTFSFGPSASKWTPLAGNW